MHLNVHSISVILHNVYVLNNFKITQFNLSVAILFLRHYVCLEPNFKQTLIFSETTIIFQMPTTKHYLKTVVVWLFCIYACNTQSLITYFFDHRVLKHTHPSASNPYHLINILLYFTLFYLIL